MVTRRARVFRIVLAVLLAGLLLATAMLWPSQDGTPAPSNSQIAQANPPLEAGRFRVGDRRRYSLEMSSSVRGKQGDTFFGFTLKGELTATVVAIANQRVTLSHVIEKPAFDAEASPATKARLLPLVEQFAVPYLFSINARGGIEQSLAATETATLVQDVAKSIAALSQFVTPPGQEPAEWTTDEYDGTGKYIAEYERRPKRLFEKRKIKYVDLLALAPDAKKSGSKIEVLESLGGFRFDAAGDLESLDLVERVQGNAGELITFLEAKTRLKLALLDKSRSADGAQKLAKLASKRASVAIYDSPLGKGSSADIDLARIAGRSFEQMASHLVSLGAGEKHKDARERLFAAMASLFRQSDGAVQEALDFIKKDSKTARFIADALASAGTPKAQAALAELIDRDTFGSRSRKSMLIGLSLVDQPTRETVGKMASLFDDPVLGRQATYGYGSAAHNLAETDPAAAEGMVGTLVNRLGSSSGAPEKVQVLRALGNAGNPAAIPAIQAHLNDSNTEVRATAVRSLRLVPGAAVDNTLVAFGTDGDVSVRQEAIHAMADRTPNPSSVRMMSALARSESDFRTRMLAVRTLGRWLDDVPEVRSTIEWVAHNDPTTDLRNMATALLRS